MVRSSKSSRTLPDAPVPPASASAVKEAWARLHRHSTQVEVAAQNVRSAQEVDRRELLDAPVAPVAQLLGLNERKLETLLDAHELIRKGLPGRCVSYLLAILKATPIDAALEVAIGMSLRTAQRHAAEPAKPLSSEQSGRLWTFAQVLAQATAVFGTQADAEAWLARPATGLNQQRPIDLLATPAGLELVETFLTRLSYGVYT